MNEVFKILLASTSKSSIEDIKRFIPTEEELINVSTATSYVSLKRSAGQNPDLVICISANRGDEFLVESAVELYGNDKVVCADYIKSYEITVKLLKYGATAYFSMPEEITPLTDLIRNRFENWKKKSEQEKFLSIRREQFDFSRFIGSSEKMKEILYLVNKAIEHRDLTVLILGETGTGKTLLARIIHQNTYPDVRPFVEVNCASIPPTLLESELFGHEKGAFTDAKERKIGLFEVANGGTIFLDEIGDLDLNLQAKLLHVIDNKSFRRVGGVENIKFEGRIIVATNQNLENLVKENKFRRDLYYRLSILPIYLPPLREREDDIFLLAEHFINEFNELYRKNLPKVRGLSFEARALLKKLPWFGNVRELRHAIERAVILTESEYLTPEDFSFLLEKKQVIHSVEDDSITISLPFQSASITNAERELISSVLSRCSWNKSRAARILGISRPRLDRLMRKYKITPGREIS